MLKSIALSVLLLPALASADESSMLPHLNVTATGINAKGFIEPKYAYCVPDPVKHSRDGHNVNIGLAWSGAPDKTASYAIIGVDNDVPDDFGPANKEGEIIPLDAKRRPFYHWVMLDIPVSVNAIAPGQESSSTAVKALGPTGYGIRAINSYTTATEVHGGYDGPCPPWNDARIHNYHFKVYALDVPSLNGNGQITGEEAYKLIKSHIIAVGEVSGKYTMNPSLIEK